MTGIPHREFWPPLMRFAFWVWVINLFCHLFGVVDRYMLVHYSGLDNTAALALVGHYHASRVVPILFLSVADLLGGAVMPYLSHDWEIGARQQVSDRLNTVLKVTAFVMLAGGVAVLWIAPLLFHVAFQGRYDEGLAVMPWTMTYCVWYSLFLVAQNYAWCAEKAKLAVLPLIAGLVINFGIDLWLIPTWGLLGRRDRNYHRHRRRHGCPVLDQSHRRNAAERGMMLFSLAPLALCGGVWCGTATLLLLAAATPFSKTLATAEERDELRQLITMFVRRWNSYWSRAAEQTEPLHAIG